MTNLGKMMKQAQEMQARMKAMQEELEAVEIEGASGGGLVTAILNGKSQLRRLKIDPSLVDPADIEVLEDLVIAAVNDAKTKVEAHAAEEMKKVTGGLQLPGGLELPF